MSTLKTNKLAHTANGASVYTLPQTDGSAGQVLKTDGSGNLSWVTLTDTNDLVKLSAATSTSSVATLDFQNLNVTTYKSFKLEFNLTPEVDGGQVFLRLFDGSTLKSSASSYNFGILDVKQEGGTYNTAAQTDYVKLIDGCGNNAIEGSRGELTFVPRVSGDPTHFNNSGFCLYNRFNTSGLHRGGTSYFRYVNNEAIDGFRLYFHAGNITAHSYTLYGIKR